VHPLQTAPAPPPPRHHYPVIVTATKPAHWHICNSATPSSHTAPSYTADSVNQGFWPAGAILLRCWRKAFTISERVAIADAVSERLAGRVGRPGNSGNISLIDSGQTRDLAATKAGLGSGKTYEAAKKVVETGSPALVAALDSGLLTINSASRLATLPIAEQEAIDYTDRGRVRRPIAHGDKNPAQWPGRCAGCWVLGAGCWVLGAGCWAVKYTGQTPIERWSLSPAPCAPNGKRRRFL